MKKWFFTFTLQIICFCTFAKASLFDNFVGEYRPDLLSYSYSSFNKNCQFNVYHLQDLSKVTIKPSTKLDFQTHVVILTWSKAFDGVRELELPIRVFDEFQFLDEHYIRYAETYGYLNSKNAAHNAWFLIYRKNGFKDIKEVRISRNDLVTSDYVFVIGEENWTYSKLDRACSHSIRLHK